MSLIRWNLSRGDEPVLSGFAPLRSEVNRLFDDFLGSVTPTGRERGMASMLNQ